ncbi:Cmx/CmrA family chloramphenicol efflux MFS transporter [Streptomyces sp. SPB074]|uniref:Cmx/CmrA family chloramphenicol efflux MFS transporter n=1 Tax=Streptomyces sp. (strain SPB074) TaxID=465543 RepID=UPI00017F17CB|nr:Cmx/CmrA family chloramphenicol efflux MFS transporter [Streptomyces sp. SPB074]EDY45137.1 chloramphenicol resistance protein [Streptomyces sp. SPB074]
MPFALYPLALAVFAMGTSEFVLAGLLPALAPDLGVTVATAGLLTPAFAVGMVVGAPLVAVLARAWPRRACLIASVLVFGAAHAAAALTASFTVLFAARVLAALAHAGFLALALPTATALVPADRSGRALAVLLAGTTAATVAGVPAGAALGTLYGWRAVFWGLAALCVPVALGVFAAVPAARGGTGGRGLRAEAAVLRRPSLLLAMPLGALVNAATFASFTYLAPVVTGAAGLGEGWVAVVLMLFGAGSFAGVTLAGRFADGRPGVLLTVTGPAVVVGWPALALAAGEPAVLLPLVCAQGAASFALGSTLVTRVLHEASGAPALAGACATTALNAGAAAGPLLAAPSLATAAGPRGPLWTSALLAVAAFVLVLRFRARLTGTEEPTPSRLP